MSYMLEPEVSDDKPDPQLQPWRTRVKGSYMSGRKRSFDNRRGAATHEEELRRPALGRNVG